MSTEPKMTPWFPASINPRHQGRYRAQDMTMRCNCCYIELEWRGGEWFAETDHSGYFRTHFWTRGLRRWRGLAEKPA